TRRRFLGLRAERLALDHPRMQNVRIIADGKGLAEIDLVGANLVRPFFAGARVVDVVIIEVASLVQKVVAPPGLRQFQQPLARDFLCRALAEGRGAAGDEQSDLQSQKPCEYCPDEGVHSSGEIRTNGGNLGRVYTSTSQPVQRQSAVLSRCGRLLDIV